MFKRDAQTRQKVHCLHTQRMNVNQILDQTFGLLVFYVAIYTCSKCCFTLILLVQSSHELVNIWPLSGENLSLCLQPGHAPTNLLSYIAR